MNILLIGAGEIAREYIKAFQYIGGATISVLTRSEKSAMSIAEEFSIENVYFGGEDKLRSAMEGVSHVVIATPIETLQRYLVLLSGYNLDKILVEKPAFLSSRELRSHISDYSHENVSVAMNRLFFPSVLKLGYILNTESVTSAEFSFTEWIHTIDENKFSQPELKFWGLSNCIHVIATVFDLIGKPTEISTYRTKFQGVEWHGNGSIFAGAGKTESGALFSYKSDWESAGRWYIKVNTAKGCYNLTPMENLTFTPKGSVREQEIELDKPENIKEGFEPMLRSWLYGDGRSPVTLHELKSHHEIIEEIFGYC